MRKWIIALLFSCTFCVGNNIAMAADYWVYSNAGYNYYAVTESLKAVKGAYDIKVKEVSPNGNCFKYGLQFYNNGKGIVYSRTPVRPGNSRMSNGHDLVAALWDFVCEWEKTHKLY